MLASINAFKQFLEKHVKIIITAIVVVDVLFVTRLFLVRIILLFNVSISGICCNIPSLLILSDPHLHSCCFAGRN